MWELYGVADNHANWTILQWATWVILIVSSLQVIFCQLYATPKVTKYQRCNFIIQIHQFTIKIDKININLLSESVKIVEFNFNSHVFHVMYQETRFLNQDACFLNQEGRRQFFINFVSERDWNRAHRLEVLTGLHDSCSSQIDWS